MGKQSYPLWAFSSTEGSKTPAGRRNFLLIFQVIECSWMTKACKQPEDFHEQKVEII